MKVASIIGLAAVLGVAGMLFYSCKPVWQFSHLERNARSVVTGAELQAWATNLLAQYPSNVTLRASRLGTNFPQRLLGLAPQIGPDVVVYVPNDTNSPGWVMVGWGSGGLGHCGFEIGPTTFKGARSGHAWQEGVYFFRE
jgi:hypothetical protein